MAYQVECGRSAYITYELTLHNCLTGNYWRMIFFEIFKFIYKSSLKQMKRKEDKGVGRGLGRKVLKEG